MPVIVARSEVCKVERSTFPIATKLKSSGSLSAFVVIIKSADFSFGALPTVKVMLTAVL